MQGFAGQIPVSSWIGLFLSKLVYTVNALLFSYFHPACTVVHVFSYNLRSDWLFTGWHPAFRTTIGCPQLWLHSLVCCRISHQSTAVATIAFQWYWQQRTPRSPFFALPEIFWQTGTRVKNKNHLNHSYGKLPATTPWQSLSCCMTIGVVLVNYTLSVVIEMPTQFK